MGTGGPLTDRPRFHAESVPEWRAWLAAHHATSTGIWLVRWKPGSGRPTFGYEEMMLEALAVGWIDGQAWAPDPGTTMQWFTPRRPRSGWSGPNKERVARLEAAGLMQPAGAAAVAAARADGSWTLLDDVEALVVPEDLAAALDALPGARAHWDSSSRSARTAVLRRLVDARRDATRAARVAEAARQAAEGARDPR
ncbi:YdeI/OmpD-associated family protein [Cellulomonas sp. Marseille-Q8402]